MIIRCSVCKHEHTNWKTVTFNDKGNPICINCKEVKKMGYELKENKLSIDFDPESKTLSKSGKTYLLASSNGFKWEGDVGISYNIVKRTTPKEE